MNPITIIPSRIQRNKLVYFKNCSYIMPKIKLDIAAELILVAISINRLSSVT